MRKSKEPITKLSLNKAQYDTDRKTAKISTLSLGNVSKYEILTGKDVLPEKDWPEKATTMKRFEHSPLGKDLKAQTDNAKKQYQKSDDTCEYDKIIKKEKPTMENYIKSNLINNAKHKIL